MKSYLSHKKFFHNFLTDGHSAFYQLPQYSLLIRKFIHQSLSFFFSLYHLKAFFNGDVICLSITLLTDSSFNL